MTWARVAVRFAPLLMLVGALLGTPASAASWGHSAIVERDGNPAFAVDGKPFFVYGAAFFYERLPAETWQSSLVRLRYDLHVNVLDLYVPWNWHELSDGDFDFEGRTNPRRNLREVLRLAHALGFKLIVRPGPVVRNEWRNGGYPAWLLERPEYGMPLRDVLEGRYPATATLQNARSDDAAAAWMRNATHLAYARRWLERVLAEFEPVAPDVLAVALDDDQGAYIDNQTWPAPHLRAYLGWLRDTVQRATSAALPVFINTYEMKVTASSPVWAMGNWYQSDTYAIGEHDRSQLEFSTGLLHTRPHQPMMLSEFQAGWLQQPQDVLPQAADPANTLLAMHTLLGSGVRGIVNFPAQDTYDPAGWEAPFANAFYAWDAALGYDAATSGALPAGEPLEASTQRAGPTRFAPTAYVGKLIETFGTELAGARVVSDAAIAYLTSAYAPARMTNAGVSAIADATLETQRRCREAALTCRLVDLRYAGAAELRRYPVLVIPATASSAGAFAVVAASALRNYVRSGGIALRAPAARELRSADARGRGFSEVEGAGDATYAEDPASGAGFLTLVNYANVARGFTHPSIHRLDGSTTRLDPITVGPRDALLLPVNVPLHAYAPAFAARDVLATSSCPIVALAETAGAPTLDVSRSLTTNAACTTRFLLGAGRAAHAVSVGSRQTRFRLAPDGRVSDIAPDGPNAPETSGPQIPRTLPIRNGLTVEAPQPHANVAGAVAYFQDVYRDGEPCVVLENDAVRLVLSPAAGGRAFVFEDKARGRNAFDTIGALRDDVAQPPPPSPTDRIARYTHQFPAGFFNRPYVATILESGGRAVVRLRYDAPDAFPNGARFERVVALAPHARAFDVAASATFAGDDAIARTQHGVLVSSLVAGDPHADGVRVLPSGDALGDAPGQAIPSLSEAVQANVAGLYDPVSHDLVMQAWSDPNAASAGSIRRYARHLTTSILTNATGNTHVAFAFETAPTLEAATKRLRNFGSEIQLNARRAIEPQPP